MRAERLMCEKCQNLPLSQCNVGVWFSSISRHARAMVRDIRMPSHAAPLNVFSSITAQFADHPRSFDNRAKTIMISMRDFEMFDT